MEFKIDMSKVVKIVVDKDVNDYMEYDIVDGTISDVKIYPKKVDLGDNLYKAIKAVEENPYISTKEIREFAKKLNDIADKKTVESSKDTEEYKKVNDIMTLIKDGTMDEIAKKLHKESLDRIKLHNGEKAVTFDDIKESFEKNPPMETPWEKEEKEINEKTNKEKFSDGVKEAMNIMKLDDKMDEIAKEKREEIAKNISTDVEYLHPSKEEVMKEDLDKVINSDDKSERIQHFKKIINDMIKEN